MKRDKRFKALFFSILYCCISMYVWFFVIGAYSLFEIDFLRENLLIIISQFIVLGGSIIIFTGISNINTFQIENLREKEHIKMLRYNILFIIVLFILTFVLMQVVRNLTCSFLFYIYGTDIEMSFKETVSYGNANWTIPQILMMFISIGIITPLIEELFFRKVLIQSFNEFPSILLIVCSVSTFLLLHNNLNQIVYVFPLAVMCSIVCIKCKKMIYPIILHSLVNVVGIFNIDMFTNVFSFSYAYDINSREMAAINCFGSAVILIITVIITIFFMKFSIPKLINNKGECDTNMNYPKCHKKILFYILIILMFLIYMLYRINYIKSNFENTITYEEIG